MRTHLKLPLITSTRTPYRALPKLGIISPPAYRAWRARAEEMMRTQVHHHHRHAGAVKAELIIDSRFRHELRPSILQALVGDLLTAASIIKDVELIASFKVDGCAHTGEMLLLLEDIA